MKGERILSFLSKDKEADAGEEAGLVEDGGTMRWVGEHALRHRRLLPTFRNAHKGAINGHQESVKKDRKESDQEVC